MSQTTFSENLMLTRRVVEKYYSRFYTENKNKQYRKDVKLTHKASSFV